MLGQKLDNPADVQLKSTGKQEKINGFDTEEYTTTFNGVQMNISIAKQYPNYQKIVEALYQAQSGPEYGCFSQYVNSSPTNIRACHKRTTQTTMGQKIVMTIELRAGNRTCPDTDFAIPGDYKELSPPSSRVRRDSSKEKSQRKFLKKNESIDPGIWFATPRPTAL